MAIRVKQLGAQQDKQNKLNQQQTPQGSTLDKTLAGFAQGLGSSAGSWFGGNNYPSGYNSGGGYAYDPLYSAPY